MEKERAWAWARARGVGAGDEEINNNHVSRDGDCPRWTGRMAMGGHQF